MKKVARHFFSSLACCLLTIPAVLLAQAAPPAPTLAVSPVSGMVLPGQRFDVGVLFSDSNVVPVRYEVTINGSDWTNRFANTWVKQNLPNKQSAWVARIGGYPFPEILGFGTHRVKVRALIQNGIVVSDEVVWNITGDQPAPENFPIVFVGATTDEDSHIYAMNRNGTETKLLITSSGMDLSPKFSPDGKKIAFVSNRTGEKAIYIANRDGSGVHMIPNSTFNHSMFGPLWPMIDWSPDGEKIAFVAGNTGGGLGTIDTNGANLTVFTTAGYAEYTNVVSMNWGPTMDEMVVQGMDYPWHQNLLKYRISSNTWEQLTNDITPSHALGGDVSSDGKILIWRRPTYDVLYDVYSMDNFPGASNVNITNFPANYCGVNPVWADHNTKVLFSLHIYPLENSKIRLINLDGTGMVTFNPPGCPERCLSADWTDY